MEKWEDTQIPPHEQTEITEQRVYDFYKWLKEEYQKDKERSKNGDRELSQKAEN